jgi:secreted PhoX family phosphatase
MARAQWVELSITNPAIAATRATSLPTRPTSAINTRLAADAVGATKMDRPEWCAVNPANGEIYFTLTNNSNRSVDPQAAARYLPDSANPRAYTDMKGTTKQNGNPNGHMVRMKEGCLRPPASPGTCTLFGAESDADAARSTSPPDQRPGLLQPRWPGVQQGHRHLLDPDR